ncbi:stage VI sporulation protein F [Alteribacter lacisalsi]|uniref:Stage VI sporulation protein F n=1 Tax=Alteribacter lacisalsi TaxID=2045244 RepID=A0A2W0HKS7_9BACI|nr:stage VI sporulation protein F [Alteribacter lacisalsi]PYZ97459.1 stage VI sporulation protein F [Alteribacter lacisalsi]
MFNMFKGFEKKTGVKMDSVIKLANSVKNANFKDEATVRDLIQRVSKLANRKITKEKEDQLVQTILSGKTPKDLGAIKKMMDEKK